MWRSVKNKAAFNTNTNTKTNTLPPPAELWLCAWFMCMSSHTTTNRMGVH